MSNRNDLTGQRFGRLVAQKPLQEPIRHSLVWECICDCGNTIQMLGYYLKQYVQQGFVPNCGQCTRKRYKNVAGEKFGKLTAIRPLALRLGNSVVWECKCDCGNIKNTPLKHLQQGATKSCGCLMRMDLTGQKFGKLTAKKPLSIKYHGVIIWECECECGDVKNVPSAALTSGKTSSCGCNRKNLPRDLTGRKYGKLTAKRRLNEKYHTSWVWECQCECGNTKNVPSANLLNGGVKSCGCLKRGRRLNSTKQKVEGTV